MISNILDENFIVEMTEIKNKINKLDDKLFKRIEFILKRICEAFGSNLGTFYLEKVFIRTGVNNYFNYGNYFLLNNNYSPCTENAIVCTSARIFSNNFEHFYDKNGNLHYWNNFPVRWLFEENFQQELIDGMKKYKEERLARETSLRENYEKIKKEEENLKKSIKSKLSKEEIGFLKIEF